MNNYFSETASGLEATATETFHKVPINGRAAMLHRIDVTQIGGEPVSFTFNIYEDDPTLYQGVGGDSESESEGDVTGPIPLSAIRATPGTFAGTGGRFTWFATDHGGPLVVALRQGKKGECWVGITITGGGSTGTFAVTLAGERE